MIPFLVLVLYCFYPEIIETGAFAGAMGLLFLIGAVSIPFAATALNQTTL